MKCIKPMMHRPEFESRYHCKLCEKEAFLDLLEQRKCGEEE
jgi:hypothetical protein